MQYIYIYIMTHTPVRRW